MEVHYYDYWGFSAINVHLALHRLIYSGCGVFRDPLQSVELAVMQIVNSQVCRVKIAVAHF